MQGHERNSNCDANDDSGVGCLRIGSPKTHTQRRRQSLRDRSKASVPSSVLDFVDIAKRDPQPGSVVEAVRSTSLSTVGLGCSVDAMEARQSAACDTLAPNAATQGELTSTSFLRVQVLKSLAEREIGAQLMEDSRGSRRCLWLETLDGGGHPRQPPHTALPQLVRRLVIIIGSLSHAQLQESRSLLIPTMCKEREILSHNTAMVLGSAMP